MELLFKLRFKRDLLCFILLCYSTPFKFVQGVVTQMPSHACAGEDITVDCDLSVPDPNSNNFRTNFIEFIVGSSDVPISDDVVNTGSSVHGGVNLTRLTAFANNSFSGDKIIRGNITLSSYTASDADIRLGCSAVYFLSGNTGATSVARETPLLTPAAPPPAPSMLSISSSNIDPNTCSATISLNWIPPSYSNRTVDLYYLSLQNRTALDSIAAPANSYSHNTILLLDTVYAYSVSASSCAGNSTAATSYLDPKTPPSAPISPQSSLSNFNTDTCSADISLSWNTPPSDIPVDRYFLYLDGSLLATTNSNSYIHSTILNINTDYLYSVTAMSCAGNSANSSVSNPIRITSYSLIESSEFACLAYRNDTGVLTISWGLSIPTLSRLNISYSLQLLYSHSRQNVTNTYTDSTNFTLPSSQLSYNTTIIPHNFTQLDGIETNITANLTIVQQCRQSFSGTAMECSFNSNNPPTPPTITTSIPPTTTTANTDASSILLVIIGCVVGAVFLLFFLIILIILIVLLIIFLTKKKEKRKHTGTDGTDVKKYQGLEEDTYSQVNKKPKPVKKDESELNYLEIDHSSGTGKIVKPPIIPKTNYADITDFPQETQYASMQTQETQYASMQN